MNILKGYTIDVLDYGFVRYIDHMGSDQRIVEAARISYHSPSKGPEQDQKLLEFLWKNRHTSPFEMCKITFNIKMPIFVMRQYVRHRMQNLNEVSARYTELPNEFYIPKVWRVQDQKNRQGSLTDLSMSTEWNDECHDMLSETSQACYQTYEALLAKGVARELARLILPVNIYTEVYSCWDLKNLLHFITLRDDPHAQWEHQMYGKAIKEITRRLFPITIGAYEKFKFKLEETT